MSQSKANLLQNESSTYLQQHKNNPVAWRPYGPDAIQEARDKDMPIFLSVGYSSCHWCHVMAGEAFSDNTTAEFLNDNFICIKVDREEYPDIDHYYQQACQLFVKTGGWPLNAFLLPDMRPFFVGTYYPVLKKGEAVTFLELSTELHRAYTQERTQVETNAENVTKAIKEGPDSGDEIEFQGHFPPPMAIMDAIKEFADLQNGGYGQAPKFPHFAFYEWAVEQMLEGMVSKEHGQHIVNSVEHMLMGGLFDHARGGIHRYSTDNKFSVPHFEKMLYDQAGLLSLLSKFSLLYPSPLVFDSLINTLDYLKSEMMHDDGYFFSAQDADSEGVEGLFFTFTKEEFEAILNEASDEKDDLTQKSETICQWFNITQEGNFERGLNVISLNTKYKKDLYSQEGWEIVRRVRKEVLAARKHRIPPATDSKGVASWNSMIISSLVDVMQYCQVDVIKKRANELINLSIEGHYKTFMLQKNEKAMLIRHSTTQERSLVYLEDYVSFAESMGRIYEITGNSAFKQNLQDTITFICDEFITKEGIFTRAKSLNDHELYPNLEAQTYDSSFKSMATSLVHLIKRARLLFMDPELAGELDGLEDQLKQFVLRNPINGGQGLRAFSYPNEAYRILKMPRKWLQDGQFLNFMAYFMPRFSLDYHEEDNESWQICNLTSCELQGENLESFMKTLRPKDPPKESKTGQDDQDNKEEK